MELWFWFAVAGAVIGGAPSFIMKIAAQRKYNAELFIFSSAALTCIVMLPIAAWKGTAGINWTILAIVTAGGMLSSLGGIFRINALKHIDTTIYYPLVKLLSPALAIAFGIVFFAESFTKIEWIGLMSGLLVPLLLITRAEEGRQNNLFKGLVLVAFTGFLSAIIAAINKYGADIYGDVIWLLAGTSFGVLVGAFLFIVYKQGLSNFYSHVKNDTSKDMMYLASSRGVLILVSFGCILYAYSIGGTLAIVHTIHSLYILIPIVLSIIFYNEHWNIRKIVAVILSVTALAMFG